ncbi:hypothetical protein KY358_06695 [Candidatus Woesearchaeota archaeon]|nr:hypothetical protein [Candidatus Woesearchaeota archaeon]
MLWFKYRWVITFSHGLCVKIVRGGDHIKELEDRFRGLSGMPSSAKVISARLDVLLKFIGVLEDIIFSASALIYREEKSLIEFTERVDSAAERLVKRLKGEKKNYAKDAKKLEGMVKKLKEKRKNLPRRMEKKLKKEKEIMEDEEKKRRDYAYMLQEVTSLIEELDYKIIRDMELEAKAQKRRTWNTYRIKENIIIRSNFRLGELAGRKGVESDVLMKKTRKKLDHFSRIVKRNKQLEVSQVKNLLKYCKVEAEDLEKVFQFAIQVSERVEERLKKIRMMIRTYRLAGLTKEYFTVQKRLNILRSDIKTQCMRLDNEFKKSKIISLKEGAKRLKKAA